MTLCHLKLKLTKSTESQTWKSLNMYLILNNKVSSLTLNSENSEDFQCLKCSPLFVKSEGANLLQIRRHPGIQCENIEVGAKIFHIFFYQPPLQTRLTIQTIGCEKKREEPDGWPCPLCPVSKYQLHLLTKYSNFNIYFDGSEQER